MGAGGVIALVGVAALLGVYFVTKQQEAKTAMLAKNIISSKNSEGLTAGSALALGGTAVATYFGGPAAGSAVLRVSGDHL